MKGHGNFITSTWSLLCAVHLFVQALSTSVVRFLLYVFNDTTLYLLSTLPQNKRAAPLLPTGVLVTAFGALLVCGFFSSQVRVLLCVCMCVPHAT